MPEHQPIDKVRCIVGGMADLAANNLDESAAVPRPETAFHRGRHWQVLVIACPVEPGVDLSELPAVERYILAALADAQVHLSAETICAKLERQRWGLHGLSTIKRALKRLQTRPLVDGLPLIAVAKRGHRGYYLRNKLPLFDRPIPNPPPQ